MKYLKLKIIRSYLGSHLRFTYSGFYFLITLVLWYYAVFCGTSSMDFCGLGNFVVLLFPWGYFFNFFWNNDLYNSINFSIVNPMTINIFLNGLILYLVGSLADYQNSSKKKVDLTKYVTIIFCLFGFLLFILYFIFHISF